MAITFAAGNPENKGPSTILKPGEYSFEVVDAKESKLEKDGPNLKKGTPKIELKLRVNDEVTIFDNLFFAERTFWKVDAFLKSIGKHPGEGKEIELDVFILVGEKGTCRVKTGKTSGGQPRNEVDGFTWQEEVRF